MRKRLRNFILGDPTAFDRARNQKLDWPTTAKIIRSYEPIWKRIGHTVWLTVIHLPYGGKAWLRWQNVKVRVVDIRAYVHWKIILWVERKYTESKGRIAVYGMRSYGIGYGEDRPTYQRLRRREQRWFVRVWNPLAERILLYVPGPGRYEGEISPSKTCWLDEHGDWAILQGGDAEFPGYYTWFRAVPWSWRDEGWMLRCDSHGFRTAWQEDREEAEATIRNADIQADPEPDDYDEERTPDEERELAYYATHEPEIAQ